MEVVPIITGTSANGGNQRSDYISNKDVFREELFFYNKKTQLTSTRGVLLLGYHFTSLHPPQDQPFFSSGSFGVILTTK